MKTKLIKMWYNLLCKLNKHEYALLLTEKTTYIVCEHCGKILKEISIDNTKIFVWGDDARFDVKASDLFTGIITTGGSGKIEGWKIENKNDIYREKKWNTFI